ncbi:FAD-binding oxidoreductase [Luteimonas sp. R10]|uniref:FAD-binding oxidoreductase n=1 Tax=Luteimonas sp. R10 TaxID=3108176 RepID=UPI003090F191|nr:FAD-binding oxidoreductase [Luteimonas sp. R10]
MHDVQQAIAPSPEPALNDVHSRLNPTRPAAVLQPPSAAAACRLVRDCATAGASLVPMGARHAMGGQQFLSGGCVLDTAALDRVLSFDPQRGLITVEAGIRWPALLQWLARYPGNHAGWTIRQKQTGADDFSLGGALASNIHGRGLGFAPFVDDVESIELVDGQGRLSTASRHENRELFALVAGGYGLFGLVLRLTLHLVPRRTLRREVRMTRASRLIADFDAAIATGCSHGDFQFSIDPGGDDFLDLGILSCYRPVADAVIGSPQQQLRDDDFSRLLHLAHTDPARAFDEYAAFYLSTHGQHYASDAQQTGFYLGHYHDAIDAAAGHRGSEMITELYVPRTHLADFLGAAAESLRRHRAQAVYGTVRLIERDAVSLLAWAREPWACVVFNLHVRHDAAGIAAARDAFRALIDAALERGGGYHLTYHRWATREQVEAAHPRFPEFLRAKRALDPDCRWSSDWYRHHLALFEG